MQDASTSNPPPRLLTVSGPIAPETAGVTDAHSHLGISTPAGAAPDASALQDTAAIQQGLVDYREAGGGTIVDCQSAGCGRDGRMLAGLAHATDVHIVAATGFHIQKYYPPDHASFSASADTARRFIACELTEGLEEAHDENRGRVRAGFIKIACEETLERSPRALLEAASQAALETGAALEVHTEHGADAERIVEFLRDAGVAFDRIVLCHMDKRPDLDLHRALAEAGEVLEYDTFFRSKYRPEENVWPLLKQMLEADLSRWIVLATDLTGADMWASKGTGPGLKSLVTQIANRLEVLGIPQGVIQGLVGANIACCLAWDCCPPS